MDTRTPRVSRASLLQQRGSVPPLRAAVHAHAHVHVCAQAT
jgi:hypothetical protein